MILLGTTSFRFPSVSGLVPCCMPPIHHFAISLQRAQYRNLPVKPSITSSVIALHFTLLGIFLRIGCVPFGRICFSTAHVRYSSPLTISPQYSRSFSHRVGEAYKELPFPLFFIYIPVIFTQLSVGVPSSHRFADFLLWKQGVLTETLRGLG